VTDKTNGKLTKLCHKNDIRYGQVWVPIDSKGKSVRIIGIAPDPKGRWLCETLGSNRRNLIDTMKLKTHYDKQRQLAGDRRTPFCGDV